MKPILIIATSFPPVGEKNCERVIKFCKYLPEFGFEPIVLTISKDGMQAFDYSLEDELRPGQIIHRAWCPALSRMVDAWSDRLSKKYRKEKNLYERKASIRKGILFLKMLFLRRIPGFLLNRMKRSLFIPDDKIFWVLPAVWKGLRLCRRYDIDVVFSSAPSFTSHLAALLIKKTRNCLWITDFRDLWTGNPNYKVKRGLRRTIEVVLDRIVVSNAKGVITVSQKWQRYLSERFLEKEDNKVFVIPNGYDLEDFDSVPERHDDTGTLIITHTGVLMPSYPMRELFEVIAGLEETLKKNLRLLLYGYIYADHQRMLERYVRKLGIDSAVHFGGSIPRKQALTVQKQADLLLVMYDGYGENVKGMIPSKIFDYIACQKPILGVLPECKASEIIRYGHCGDVVEGRDITAIQKLIHKYYEAKQDGLSLLPSYNWDYLRQYERKAQCHQLVQIINTLHD